MPEELKTALVDFVQRLIDLVNSGADQLPAITKDIVGAALLSATMWWWFGLIAMIIGILMMTIDIIADFASDGFLVVVGFVTTVGGGLILSLNWYNYIYATRFPRLVILEYLRHLL